MFVVYIIMCLVQSVPRTLAEVEKRVIAEVELDMYLIIISSGAKYKYYATFFMSYCPETNIVFCTRVRGTDWSVTKYETLI